MLTKKGTKGIYWCDFRSPSGERIRQSLHTTDEGTAIQAAAKLLALDGKVDTSLTIEEAYRHAMRVREQWRSAKQLRGIQLLYDATVRQFGATTRLSQLTDDMLLAYGEQLVANGLTGSTINKRFGIINVLFDEAIKWRKHDGHKPRTVRYKVNPPRQRLITPKEQAQAIAILRAGESPYHQAMADLVTVLADTGMRLSEALKLEPIHLHPQYRAVLVTKTKNGKDRSVPLTQRALDILVNRAKMFSVLMYPLTCPTTCSKLWGKVRNKMGLEHETEFVLHALRHTYGSTLANAGTDAFRIQQVMGHENITTTQGYVKVSMSALNNLPDVIERTIHESAQH